MVFVSIYLGVSTLLWGGRGFGAAMGALIFFGGIGATIGAIRGRAPGGFRVGGVVGILPLLGFIASDQAQTAISLSTTHLPL